MKYKIQFDIMDRTLTIEVLRSYSTYAWRKPEQVIIEFETDSANPLHEASELLKKQMGDQPYDVMYWWWMKGKE